jgi:hypothetical protein
VYAFSTWKNKGRQVKYKPRNDIKNNYDATSLVQEGGAHILFFNCQKKLLLLRLHGTSNSSCPRDDSSLGEHIFFTEYSKPINRNTFLPEILSL